MDDLLVLNFGDHISARIRDAHQTIATRWLARLSSLLPGTPGDVFPGDRLLDHIPDLVREIAAYVHAPEAEAISANTAVMAKAQELGELRHEQHASIHQLVQEYRILGEILTAFVIEELAGMVPPPAALECVGVMHRLNQCVGVLLQATVDRFITEYTDTIEQQTKRLESFNRMVSHELRQPLATLQYAMTLLGAHNVPPEVVKRGTGAAERSVRQIAGLLRNLETLSRLRAEETPPRQRVELSSVAREIARELAEMADARGVAIQIADDLPTLVVDVGRVELVLVNLLSNAIKYSDPAKPARRVDVALGPRNTDLECTLVVRDNGLGIPSAVIHDVFNQFFRAHADRDRELGTDGIGLGLSIVSDCVSAIGGEIAVHSAEGEGTTFTITLPYDPPEGPGSPAVTPGEGPKVQGS